MSSEDALNTVYKVYLTLLLFGGLFGHIMAGIVFVRFANIAGPNTRRLFVSLSVSDGLVLLTAVLRYWINLFFAYDIRKLSIFGCRLHTFLVYVFGDLALWILVSMSAVRLVCVLRPTWRAPQTAAAFVPALLASLVVVSVARNFLLFFSLNTVVVSDDNATLTLFCIFAEGQLASASRLIDFIMYSAVPCTVLIFCNVGLVILLKLLASKTRKQFQNNGKHETVAQHKTGAVMILVLSAFYLLTNLPTIGFGALPILDISISLDNDTSRIVSNYLYMLHYIANGTSCLFYYCFNPNFRKCFNHVIACKRGRVAAS